MVGGELWKTNVLLSAFFFPGWVLVDANMNTTVYSWKEWSLVKLLLLFVTGRLFSLTSKTQCKRYSLQRSFKKDLKFLTLQCQLLKILSLLAAQSKSNALLCLITVEMHLKRMNYHCHHFYHRHHYHFNDLCYHLNHYLYCGPHHSQCNCHFQYCCHNYHPCQM